MWILLVLFSSLTNEYGNGGNGGKAALVFGFNDPIEIVLLPFIT